MLFCFFKLNKNQYSLCSKATFESDTLPCDAGTNSSLLSLPNPDLFCCCSFILPFFLYFSFIDVVLFFVAVVVVLFFVVVVSILNIHKQYDIWGNHIAFFHRHLTLNIQFYYTRWHDGIYMLFPPDTTIYFYVCCIILCLCPQIERSRKKCLPNVWFSKPMTKISTDFMHNYIKLVDAPREMPHLMTQNKLG